MQSTSASLILSSCSLPQRQATNEWGNFHLKQPFGIFSEHGERLSSAQEAGHHVKLTSNCVSQYEWIECYQHLET